MFCVTAGSLRHPNILPSTHPSSGGKYLTCCCLISAFPLSAPRQRERHLAWGSLWLVATSDSQNFVPGQYYTVKQSTSTKSQLILNGNWKCLTFDWLFSTKNVWLYDALFSHLKKINIFPCELHVFICDWLFFLEMAKLEFSHVGKNHGTFFLFFSHFNEKRKYTISHVNYIRS